MIQSQQAALEAVVADKTRLVEHRLNAMQALLDFGAIDNQNMMDFCRRTGLTADDLFSFLSPEEKVISVAHRILNWLL